VNHLETEKTFLGINIAYYKFGRVSWGLCDSYATSNNNTTTNKLKMRKKNNFCREDL
jgi:hypothetical protein